MEACFVRHEGQSSDLDLPVEPVETNDAVEIEEELWVNEAEVGQDVVG